MSEVRGSEPAAAFDEYARQYEQALAVGLRFSGEGSSYFAAGRVDSLRRRLDELGERPRHVLDFGCGTGGSAGYLLDTLGAERVTGVDPSPEALRVARERWPNAAFRFVGLDEIAVERHDLAYCNGVFHHIPLSHRAEALSAVRGGLRPGGLFALCENNPWNPGTQLVMRSIPFDRDASKLAAPTARRLLRAGGFEVLGTDYLFFFPRALAMLRPLEGRLSRVALGAQYMVFARRVV